MWFIRKALPEDISFIYSSWLHSYRHNSALGKSGIRTSTFFENYREVIDAILDHSIVLVACLPEDPMVICGYLVYDHSNVIHYCFVKEPMRRFGIARSLVAFAELPTNHKVEFSHQTFGLSKAIAEKYPNFNYNPFILFHREPTHD